MWSIFLRLSVALNARRQCRWVSRWLRYKKVEEPGRSSGGYATAAPMVLIMKRGCKVCRFTPVLINADCVATRSVRRRFDVAHRVRIMHLAAAFGGADEQ